MNFEKYFTYENIGTNNAFSVFEFIVLQNITITNTISNDIKQGMIFDYAYLSIKNATIEFIKLDDENDGTKPIENIKILKYIEIIIR